MFKGGLQATLLVKDVTKSVRFYRDIMGFEFRGFYDPETKAAVTEWPHDHQPPYAEVYAGDTKIGFRPAGDKQPAPGTIVLTLQTERMDVLYERLNVAGAARGKPTEQPWGGVTLSAQDPDGYHWLFLYFPQKQQGGR